MTNSNDLTATQAKSHIEKLPNKILLKILKDVPPESIIPLIKTSKALSRINFWDIVFDKMLNAPFMALDPEHLPSKRSDRIKKLFNSEWFNETDTADAKESTVSKLTTIVNHPDFLETLLDRIILISSRANPSERDQEEIQKIANRNFGIIQGALKGMQKELQTVLILSVLAYSFEKYTYQDIANDYYEQEDMDDLDDLGMEATSDSPPQQSLDLFHLCLLAKKYCDIEDSPEIQKSIEHLREVFYQFVRDTINYCNNNKDIVSKTFAEIFCNIYTNTIIIEGLLTKDLSKQLIETGVDLFLIEMGVDSFSSDEDSLSSSSRLSL